MDVHVASGSGRADRVRLAARGGHLPDRSGGYYGGDRQRLDLPLNCRLLDAEWGAPRIRETILGYLDALFSGASPCWVIASYDRPRIASRIGPAEMRLAAMLAAHPARHANALCRRRDRDGRRAGPVRRGARPVRAAGARLWLRAVPWQRQPLRLLPLPGEPRRCMALNFADEEDEAATPGAGQIRFSTHLDRAGKRVEGSVRLRPHEGLILGIRIPVATERDLPRWYRALV